MDLNDDVVDRWRRLRPFYQRHSGHSCGLISYHDRFHGAFPLLVYLGGVAAAAYLPEPRRLIVGLSAQF